MSDALHDEHCHEEHPEHHHDHAHPEHGQEHHHHRRQHDQTILTVRATSGLSGDMMLAGLIKMTEITTDELEQEIVGIGLEALHGCLHLERRCVNHVNGWSCAIDLPHEHSHRTLADIRSLIRASALTPQAKELAEATFARLAEAEGSVHGLPMEQVKFHEVGALDSILDICLNCALFVRLSPDRFICSPLPLGDGGVLCAHGWLPVPAPAVLHMLENVPVCGFAGQGETVTPTALALLKSLGAEFGPWPSFVICRQALVYGDYVFQDAPNGIIWAYGRASTHE